MIGKFSAPLPFPTSNVLTESSHPGLSILKLQALNGEYDSAGRERMPPQSREMDFVSSGGVREFSIMQAALNHVMLHPAFAALYLEIQCG